MYTTKSTSYHTTALFKRFRLLPVIHSFDQRRANAGQKTNKSWMKCSNGLDTTQLFGEQMKSRMEIDYSLGLFLFISYAKKVCFDPSFTCTDRQKPSDSMSAVRNSRSIL